MTWAYTKITNGPASLWGTSGHWTPNGVPGINDYVQIDHGMTVNTNPTFAGLYVNTGSLVWNSGYVATVKNAAGTHYHGEHILVSANTGSGFYRADTGNHLPCVIKSENTNPTYRVKTCFVGVAGYDARLIDLTLFEWRDSMVYLGNYTDSLWFNTGDVTNDGIINLPSKVKHDQKYNSHLIPGRNAGRITRVGGHPGTLDINGIVPWLGWQEEVLETMRDSNTRLAFLSQFVSMPKCRIENLRPGEPRGMWQPFSLTLVEDI